MIRSDMPHQLGIVDIMMSLNIASRRSGTHEVDSMVPDFVFENIEGKPRIATIESMGTAHELRADLIAHIYAKILERSFTVYFELERKSRDSKKILKKFDNYSVLFKAKERRFNDGTPVLLYVVTDCSHERDTKERIKLVSKWASTKPIAPAFRITSLSKVKKNAFGQVWMKADGTPWSIGG